MARKFLCVYHDMLPALENLQPAEVGRLIVAALKYDIRCEKPVSLPGREDIIWPVIMSQIDRSHEQYNELCERNRRNAATRYQSQRVVTSRSESLPIEENKTEQNRIKQNKTEHNIKSAEGRSGKKQDAFTALAGEDADLLGALKDFEAMRSRIKKPLTDGAKERIVSRLSGEFPRDQWVAVLNQSTDRCWQDLYPLKAMPGTHGANSRRPEAVPINELLDRI